MYHNLKLVVEIDGESPKVHNGQVVGVLCTGLRNRVRELMTPKSYPNDKQQIAENFHYMTIHCTERQF